MRRLAEPLERRKPTIYLVNSMSDLFHEKVSFSYIERVFDVFVNGKAVLKRFDIVAAAGGKLRAVDKSFRANAFFSE